MDSRTHLHFQSRPLLVSGMFGQVDEGDIILINSEDEESQRVISTWHEIIHFLQLSGGNTPESHNETEIEATARKLAAACPEVMDWVFPGKG